MVKSKRSSLETVLVLQQHRFDGVLDTVQLEGLIPQPETSLLDDPWHIAIVLSLAAVFTGWKIYRKRSSPAQTAKRNIKALLHVPKNTTQDTAIALSSFLREGLEVTRLEQFSTEKSAQWKDFLNHLNKACYEEKSLSNASLKNLFDQALFWLNKQ